MALLSLEKVCLLPDTPSRRTLYNMARESEKYDFILHIGNGTKIDVDHPSWLDYLDKFNKRGKYQKKKRRTPTKSVEKSPPRAPKKQPKTTPKKEKLPEVNSSPPDPSQETTEPDNICDVTVEQALGILKSEQARNQALKNKKLEIEIQQGKENLRFTRKKNEVREGSLVSVSISKHLFTSYAESLNLSLLKIPKKIAVKIDNLVNNNQPDEIIALLMNEISTVLIETKKHQAETIEAYFKQLMEDEK